MRPLHKLPSVDVISRNVSPSFARPLRDPRRGYPPPFSSPSPVARYIFASYLPIRFSSHPPIENPMKFIHLTATPDTRLPGITRLI